MRDESSRWDGTGEVDGEAAAWAVFQLLSLPLEEPPTGAVEEEPREQEADPDVRPGRARGP